MAVDILRAAEGHVDERVALIRWPGPLAPELEGAADRAYLEPGRRLRVALRRYRRTRPAAIRVEERVAAAVLRRERPDLVYLNTVLSACYARPALAMGCRVVLHSHEMEHLAPTALARYRLKGCYEGMRLVACSGAAAACLQAISGTDDVEVVPSVVDPSRVLRLAQESLPRSIFGPLVVACGTANSTKGTDLWLEVAHRCKAMLGSKCPTFVWVGPDPENLFEHLSEQMGLGGTVHFTGPALNPYPLIAAADLVTVSSRHDASPLVIFEAMVLGKPVIAFDVGGIAEQVGASGVLLPPEDVNGMSQAIGVLLADRQRREDLGQDGRHRVHEHFGYETFQHQVQDIIRRELEGLANESEV